MPRVSIVLVNYNHDRYLDERITSILEQTYRDFELIIIDNGSTDDSLKIINKYQSDPRVRIQAFSDNISPYKRWNDSIDSAIGEYLMLVCADDSCKPRLLEKLVGKLDDYPSVDFAYSQALEIDSEGKLLRSCKYWTDELDEQRWCADFVDSGENECRYLYFKCSIINVGSVLMRRLAFTGAGKFDTKMRYSSDWMLYAKILANTHHVAFIAEPLNYLRVNTSTLIPDEGDFIEARVQILQYLWRTVSPPGDFFEKIYEPTIGWWLRAASSGKMTLSQSLRIYRIMGSIDPYLCPRIIKYLFKVVTKYFAEIPSYKFRQIIHD